MASTYLSRAGGTPTSTRKFTISFWVKKSNISGDEFLVSTFTDSNNRMQVDLNSSDLITFICYVSGSLVIRKRPNRKLRDPSGFYHITVAVDTTQATAADRCKIYINGEQETSFSIDTNPSQNADLNVSGDHFIGAYDNGGSPALFFNGLMTHIHYTDGYTYAASTFGETDSTSGIWKPKTSPSVTYGTNGYFLKFENSGAMGTDSSGNTNTFTVSGTLTQNIDTPSNNFCTLNSLDTNSNHTFSNGNTKIAYSASGGTFGVTKGSLGVSSGKWYYEVKYTYGNAGQFGFFDVNDIDTTNTTDVFSSAGSSTFEGLAWRIDGSGNIKECANGQTTDTTVDFSSGDILGIAFDADNGKLYGFKNGVELTGQDISAGTSLMTAVTVSDFYLPFISNGDGGGGTKTGTSEVNFGSGYFGTTAVASAGTAPSEGGIFEYDCPSGYQALCTKGINSF